VGAFSFLESCGMEDESFAFILAYDRALTASTGPPHAVDNVPGRPGQSLYFSTDI
jgi:hypothetical protein